MSSSGEQAIKYAVVNGNVRPLDEPQIFLNDSYYANGIGVYETLRFRHARLYFLSEHIHRLHQSAEIIGITGLPEESEIRRHLHLLIRENRLVSSNIKVLLLKNSRGCDLYMYPVEIPPLKGNRDPDFPEPIGVDLAAYRGERHFPRAKSLSMLLSTRALEHAREWGCWDSVLIDRRDLMLEGSRANLYWLEEDGLYSPPEDSILSGVTRMNFRRSLEKHGIRMKEGLLSYDDFLARPRPLLMTSTSIAVQPVKRFIDLQGNAQALPVDGRTDEYARMYGEYLRNYGRSLNKS